MFQSDLILLAQKASFLNWLKKLKVLANLQKHYRNILMRGKKELPVIRPGSAANLPNLMHTSFGKD